MLTVIVQKTGIDSFVSGIGPAATSCSLTRFFEKKGKRIVVLAGLAGGYTANGAQVGNTCMATSEVFGDLGICVSNGIEPLDLRGENIETFFPLEKKWGNILTQNFLIDSGIIPAPMATVSCVSGTRERAQKIVKAFDAYAENMEGAAAALVCKNYNMPLLEIRSISNEAGELDKKKWKTHDALRLLREKTEMVINYLLHKKDE